MSVAGKDAPESVNPAPESVAEVTVTGTLPVELSVRVWLEDALTATLPKAMEDELTASVGVAALSCSEKLCEAPLALAVRLAACAVATEATEAVKATLPADAGTTMDEGTVTALLLLARATVTPPAGAAAFRVAVQEDDPAPVNDVVEQESELRTATPVPLRATVAEAPLEELLTMAMEPAAAPATVGSN